MTLSNQGGPLPGTRATLPDKRSLSSSRTETAAISPGIYAYDVEYTQSDTTTVERVAEGIITISEEATK